MKNADNIVAFITGSVMDELQEIYPDILSEKKYLIYQMLFRVSERKQDRSLLLLMNGMS